MDRYRQPVVEYRLCGHSHYVANNSDKLQAGDRVRLSGGYDFEPAWLSGKASVEGTVAAFIPGQNKNPAAVIKLDEPISAEGATGDALVLELRYVGANWGSTEIVHVELCNFMPEPKRWQDRRQGKWVESHATCERLRART
jgi:hypothetical protein